MTGTPGRELARFLAKFTPEVAALADAVLAGMRARLPGAFELVYDNYNALAIGFGPSERASEAVFSIAVWPRWVSLCFFEGAHLPDPEGRLKGSGKRARHIILKDAADLEDPAVQTLISHALERAAWSPVAGSSGRIVIKSISPRQRPRRPRS